MTSPPEQAFSLLDEPLIRYRSIDGERSIDATLPDLLAAMSGDEVRDFPSLRPHQRHPWHAFLVHLGAIAMHRAGASAPLGDAVAWRSALLALTPDDPDGAAWCLVAPPGSPALLQAPVPGGSIAGWKSASFSADEIDMLVTSKNHDLKGARMRRAEPQDWIFALVSLQTQEGFLGAGNYGVSRMNGGFASRPGVGIAACGAWGVRWRDDVLSLLASRARTVEMQGLANDDGLALVWLVPWNGESSLAFGALDPHYIELCRRIRLRFDGVRISALGTGTKVARIASKERNGVTGDAWTPIETAAGKALTIGAMGFHYKLVAELLFGGKFQAAIAHDTTTPRRGERHVLITQCVTRGQGKTEGYHERRVPISPAMRRLLTAQHKPALALIAGQRIAAIGEVRKLLWLALTVLFNNGAPGKDSSDSVKNKATEFSDPFERAEDGRFFADLDAEIEAADPAVQRLVWQEALVARAAAILQRAFAAGPRSAIQRYRAQAAASSRFFGALHGDKSPLPELANHYKQRRQSQQQEATRDHA
jgi:CRISPR system Cascade subunit CasA